MLISTVRLNQVAPHPHNIRRDIGDVTELAESFKASGMLQPLIVAPAEKSTPDKPRYTLIAGHRRLAAAKACGWKDVEVIVRHDLDTKAKQIETMAVENLQRTDLSPVEEARGYQQLLDLGYTPAKIATRIGRSAKTVKLRLGLNKLSEKASEKLHAGQITIEQAEVLASFAKDPKAYKDLEAAIGTNNFVWKVAEVKAKQAKDAKRSKLIAQLDKDGVPHKNAPAGYPWRSVETPLAELGLEVDAHGSCPGHSAVIIDDYRGLRVEYVCTDPVANGHRSEAPDPASDRGSGVEDDPARVAAAKRIEDLRIARTTRREFVSDLVSRSLDAPAVSLRTTLRALALALFEEVNEYASDGVLADLFGFDPELDDEQRDIMCRRVVEEAQTTGLLAKVLLAELFALHDPELYSFGEPAKRALLDGLVDLGYQLSDVELAELERTAPKPRINQCRECGCTDDDACEGGCAWTDETATLCTSCVTDEEPERPVQDVTPSAEFADAI